MLKPSRADENSSAQLDEWSNIATVLTAPQPAEDTERTATNAVGSRPCVSVDALLPRMHGQTAL